MLLLDRRDDGLFLVDTRRARPEWLGAVPLSLLAALPLVGPGPVSGGRVALALVLGALSTFLITRSLPRRTVSCLERRGSTVSLFGENHEPVAVALGGEREDGNNSALCFTADVISTRTRVRVLAHMDPGVVAGQAEELARFLGVPLEPGWGLDARALSPAAVDGGPSTPAPVSVLGMLRPSQRAAGFSVLGSTVFILCFTAVLLSGRWERGLEVATLSLVLATVMIGFGFGVAAWLLGTRTAVSVSSDGLEVVRLWQNQRLRRELIPLRELSGVFAVSPDGKGPTHLLTRGKRGWLAFPLTGEPAQVIAARFSSISHQTERPLLLPEAPDSTDFSGIRTASG